MTNCDTKVLSEAKLIRKKEPYVNGNTYIQQVSDGKNKDIGYFNVSEGRYDSHQSPQETRGVTRVVQEKTKDHFSKEVAHRSNPRHMPSYSIEYNLMSDFDVPHSDVYYSSPNMYGYKKTYSYTQYKTSKQSDVPNYMVPLNYSMENSGLIKESKIIKMI